MTLPRLAWLAIVSCLWLSTFGCSSTPVPPPAMTGEIQAAIKADDAKVQAAESQQKGK